MRRASASWTSSTACSNSSLANTSSFSASTSSWCARRALHGALHGAQHGAPLHASPPHGNFASVARDAHTADRVVCFGAVSLAAGRLQAQLRPDTARGNLL